MRIVALYKTFDGEEFIEASIESIYPFVEKIVMVHSDIGWTGRQGNTVKPIAEAMPDPEHKIIHIDVHARDQETQYQAGVAYIKANLDYELVMLIDADEIWDAVEMEKAIQFVADHPREPAYTSGMWAYIKTPFYRIVPTEGRPVIFVRDASSALEGARGVGTGGKCLMWDVKMHHFTAVRKSKDSIRDKIMSSYAGDLADGDMPEPDVEKWLGEKYDKIPEATDFHYFPHVAHLWREVEKIWIEDVPATLRDKPIYNQYLPKGLIGPDEEHAIYDFIKGRMNCIELGTFRGRNAIVMSLATEEVLTIDLFENSEDAVEEWSDGTTKEDVVRQLAPYSNISILQGRTHDFAGQTKHADVLLIDGDHSYEGVKRDFESWYPEVRQGGLIIFHDCNDSHPHIQRFVNETQEKYPLLVRLREKERGSLAFFGKC